MLSEAASRHAAPAAITSGVLGWAGPSHRSTHRPKARAMARPGSRTTVASSAAHEIVNDPRLLIVDEPTAGLDPQERIRFRNLLTQLAAERTVLLSTHIVEDIAQSCHHLAVLAMGRIAFHGTVPEL